MAEITDYSSLKTEIANWLDRTDLTGDIPGFVQLAEARLNQKIRIRPMEQRVTASTVADQEYYALPDGYVQMRSFSLATSPKVDLEYLTPESMDSMILGSVTGRPQAYSVVADTIRLGPTPDAEYTMQMVYWQKFSNLSSSVTTNWLVENAPNLLLAACMMEAAMFVKDPELLMTWKGYYEFALSDIETQDSKDRHSGGALFMRSAHMGA